MSSAVENDKVLWCRVWIIQGKDELKKWKKKKELRTGFDVKFKSSKRLSRHVMGEAGGAVPEDAEAWAQASGVEKKHGGNLEQF